MTNLEIYNSKLGTLQDALDLVRSGDRIAFGIYGCEPVAFLEKLHTIADRVENVEIWTSTMQKDYQFMLDNSMDGHINILSFFYERNARKIHNTRRVTHVPTNLHSLGSMPMFKHPPSVFVCTVSPMDESGYVRLSTDLQGTLEWMEHAEKVIFEVNPAMPVVYGETAVSVEKATCIYEVPFRPLPVSPPVPNTPVEKRIGEYVAELVRDGDCIQLGVGGVPSAVADALRDKKDLGVHTEMIPPAVGMLMRAGVITNERKNFYKGKVIGAFLWGDEDLYRMADKNPAFELRRCAFTNDPFMIAMNDNMVSINTALQVDLTGQICSESIGVRQFSGTGGATDFAYGAAHSDGGRGIIAMTSTTKNGTVSKIRPVLDPGGVVSISRNLVNYIVTEYGVADLRGASIRERVDSLIAIAHPDFREDLRKEAEAYMLW